jgi:Cof subfamily protein (haloacid dehalogenase superfamily)
MYQIIICDLDGTLLNSGHTISKYTQDVIKAVKDKGVIICIATGRHHLDAMAYQRMLGLDSFLITSNGAKIHDEHGHEIYSENISASLAHQLIHTVTDSEVIRHVFRDDDWYCDQPWKLNLDVYKDSGAVPMSMPFHDIEGEITKFCFEYHHRPNKLLHLEEILLARFEDRLSIGFSSPVFLEVMKYGVSKGAAVKKITNGYNLDLKNAIAFGDALNDYDMLMSVGKGVLMGNCEEALRRMLPGCEAAETNDNDGLARYLEKL